MLTLFRFNTQSGSCQNAVRSFSTSSSKNAGQNYRLKNKMERSGNKVGILREKPDFKYLDGTPGPLNKGTVLMQGKRTRELERAQRLLKEMEEDVKVKNIQQFY
eukprot:TRINITY_DN6915_c0_g1_i1.p1 TRINITY_DN6915_c0_g1~~TRINITY_DN6915_c0_g1_i1.p1  ORF type:complete len:104 (-),score=38.41 TRINITY_DN6915_c0_g1_i1:28-339(-)